VVVEVIGRAVRPFPDELITGCVLPVDPDGANDVPPGPVCFNGAPVGALCLGSGFTDGIVGLKISGADFGITG